jgi:hypothetical protein
MCGVAHVAPQGRPPRPPVNRPVGSLWTGTRRGLASFVGLSAQSWHFALHRLRIRALGPGKVPAPVSPEQVALQCAGTVNRSTKRSTGASATVQRASRDSPTCHV